VRSVIKGKTLVIVEEVDRLRRICPGQFGVDFTGVGQSYILVSMLARL
jgi:hypothetical protein